MVLLQIDATGQFDPVGTIVVLVLIVVFGYAARAGWQRYQANDGGRRYGWLALGIVGAFVAIIGVVSFLINIAAALGLM